MKIKGIFCLVIMTFLSQILIGCKSTPTEKGVQVAVNSQQVKSEPNIPLSELPESPFNTPYYYTSTKRIFSLMDRAHYVYIKFDDNFSERVFNQIIKAVDPNNEYLSLADIKKLSENKYSFDNIIKTSDLSEAYIFIESLNQIIDQKLSNAITLAGKAPAVSKGNLSFIRSKLAHRVESNDELIKYWTNKVKIDAQNLRYLGVEKEQINETLQNRYLKLRDKHRQQSLSQKYSLLMNGYAKSIDPHTRYLTPILPASVKSVAKIPDDSPQEYGIGLVLNNESGDLKVKDIYPTSPADEGGIRVGDSLAAIVHENGEYIDLQQMDATEAQKLLNGELGSKVNLKAVRKGSSGLEIVEFSLVRNSFSMSDFKVKGMIVTSPLNKADIGIIKIGSFYNGVSDDVKKEVKKLTEQNISGLLVDLRNNGGGSLYEPTKVAGLFIQKGPVFQIRDGSNKVTLNVIKDESIYYHGPITVLVNGASAGSSEIFSAAMQDYGRGIVLGEQTFGYGTVQQHRGLSRVYDLFDEPLGSLQYTLAKFYRVNGESTQHKGVTPDISLYGLTDDGSREKESDFALPWDTISSAKYTQQNNTSTVKVAIKSLKKQHPSKPDVQGLVPSVLLEKALEITDEYIHMLNNTQ
jgi:carboxyl-terminal processing protease